ncbi:hypothetical protein [Kitasatospora sp. NBC_01539]|uniref:hypothetical protein n=1 Tax=Kitasatospora sp. NBC_01539 TaxID=2903577 RepID=UPI0038601D90
MKRLILPLLCAGALALGGTACSSGDKQSSAITEVAYHAAYPSFTSSSELFGKADLVIEAVALPGSEVRNLTPNIPKGDDPRLNPAAGTGTNGTATDKPLVVTVVGVTVGKVYKGAVKAGDRVEIKQLGGLLGTTRYTSDDKQLTPGQSYLLYLTTFPDAPASMITPLQGQYALQPAGSPEPLGGNTLTPSVKELEGLAAAAR